MLTPRPDRRHSPTRVPAARSTRAHLRATARAPRGISSRSTPTSLRTVGFPRPPRLGVGLEFAIGLRVALRAARRRLAARVRAALRDPALRHWPLMA